MPKIYAIVVVYNGLRRNWIEKCFDSLLRSSVNIEIIAIDNGSTDSSVEYIKNNYPQVNLIDALENLGFGKANNLGIKKAIDLGTEYVFLLNQDAFVESESIEILIRHARDNPEFGVISPIHLDGTGIALDKNFSNYVVPSKCQHFLSDAVLNKVEDRLYPLDFVNAAAWLIPNDCLRKVGGFSPLFFHYGEDDNYCHRVLYKGLKIGICPRSFVYHDRQERENTTLEEASRRKLVGRLINAADPNDESLPIAEKEMIKDGLRVLFNTGSISECVRILNFYRNQKNNIQAVLEQSRSDKEYLFIG